MKSNMNLRRVITLSIIWLLVLANFAYSSKDDLKAIQEAIKAKGAKWTPGESWVTRLTAEERIKLLGEKTLELGIVEPITPPLITGYPSAIDWRNKDGHNWVTSIKDQKNCGSCVAFGSLATLESLVRIEQNEPDKSVDLSEMHLFNCGGGSCDYGWYNSEACYYLMNNGTPDETCWPYQPENVPCSNTCYNWQERSAKITNYGYIWGGGSL